MKTYPQVTKLKRLDVDNSLLFIVFELGNPNLRIISRNQIGFAGKFYQSSRGRTSLSFSVCRVSVDV